MSLPSLRSPGVLVPLGLGSCAATLWFLGPHLGLVSAAGRLAGILLVLLLSVTVLHLRRLRGSRPPAPPAQAQAAAAGGKRLARDQVQGAVRTVQASHLGATRGRAALYELPWLLLLGHTQAGKSLLVHHSGLTFPLSRNPEPPEPGQPEGCRWAFATEGILLDAPGRYLDDGHQAEWQAFLRQLKAHRPAGPLEGILVAVELPDLLQAGSRAFADRARQLRGRIGDVERRCGMKLPVYLVFTKMDLLQGFQDFFGESSEAERREVWGATLPQDQGSGFDPVGAVEAEFAQLRRGLAARAEARLERRRDGHAWVTFPAAFHRLGQAVRGFTEHLVGQDPYHARPFIRGFYFTSAIQEAGPAPATPGPLAPFGLQELPAAAGPGAPCFLEHLFRQVIFPDRFLSGSLGAGRLGRPRIAGMAAGTALLGLLAGLWAWSFTGNRKLCAASRQDLARAQALLAGPGLGERMAGLDLLQARLEQFGRQRREGRPWALGWGLYLGPHLERTLRRRYFLGVSELMLAPVQASLEQTLARAGTGPRPPAAGRGNPAAPGEDREAEQLYHALKTYLMLQERQRMEPGHLADQLPRCWRPALEGAGGPVLGIAERTVAFYLSQLREPDLPVISTRPELVAGARARLRAQARLKTPLEQFYNTLKARANTEFEAMTVARILKDRDLDLMAGSHAIPGSFTRDAYETFFQAAFRDLGQGVQSSDWVLAARPQDLPAEAPEGVRSGLEELYKAEYRREWDAFLLGVGVHGFRDAEAAAEALGRLGDPQQSPLRLILARAAQETSWDNPGELEKSLGGLKDGVLARTGKLLGQRTPAVPRPQHGPLGGHFAALSQLAGPGDGGSAPLDGYLQLLQKARTRLGGIAQGGDPYRASREYLQSTLLGAGSELAEAQMFVETGLLSRVDGHGREILRPILLRPLVQAFAALVPAAEQDINRAWTQQVWSHWTALADKYPFADSGSEASLADIHRFLQPGEGILPRFMDKYLGPLVVQQGDRFAPRYWAGRGVAFRAAFLNGVSRLCQASALVQASASRFELQPVPVAGMKEILLEIDGQKLHYRNGPQTWTGFSWPGQSALQGARIQVVAFSGATVQVHSAPGRMGLLRLLAQARAGAPEGSARTLEWSSGQARVRFNYRLVSGPDPLRLSALRNHSLPSRAVQ